MIILSVQELHKYYGSTHVLKGLSFEVVQGQKVGLLGKNGSGKTTLFKVLSGVEEYEEGEIAKLSGTKIEVLDQIPVIAKDSTVEAVLHSAFEEAFRTAEEMAVLEELIKTDHSKALLSRYGSLQTTYEALGGYDFESRIDRICSGMKIDKGMRGRLFSTLSGGEQTRVNLARILLRDSDILLLDEPTNHLDMGMIEWLEEYLKGYKGTVIAISHDRYFLDNAVGRIFEMDDGTLTFYEGNYTYYVEEKERRFLQQQELYEQQQKKIHQLEVAAKRMHEWAKSADSPAMHRRAFAIEKRIERIDKVERPREAKKLTNEFGQQRFSGDDIVILKNVGKRYGELELFRGINLTLYKKDRVALIGDNGCGKSTLVKLIMGDIAADSGVIRVGNSVKSAYLPQEVSFDDPEETVLNTLRFTYELTEERTRFILAGFHFKGEDVYKKVGTLSGGERSRLKLCLLMQRDVNFLILDEPTNHLDIPSREWIEDAVSGFSGTVLFISHDRYFLNKFATRIWEMDDGMIADFDGGYEEYSAWKKKTAVLAVKTEVKKEKKEKPVSPGKREAMAAAQRERKIKELENKIAAAENRLKTIEMEMTDAASNAERLHTLYVEKTDLEKEIDSLLEQWSMQESE